MRLQLTKLEHDGKFDFQPDEASDIRPWAADEPLRVGGQPHPRVEGMEKVTGRARYAYDQRLPRQLYTRVLRSPYPHARIRRIDTSRAEVLPGVYAVLSSANCPDVRWYQEQSLLFDPILRFVGDEVAAVAAETEDIADDALRLIDVDYEPLPFVPDLGAALPARRPAGPADARPRSRKPGCRQPQPDSPARAAGRSPRRRADRHRGPHRPGAGSLRGGRRSRHGRWDLPDAVPLPERAH